MYVSYISKMTTKFSAKERFRRRLVFVYLLNKIFIMISNQQRIFFVAFPTLLFLLLLRARVVVVGGVWPLLLLYLLSTTDVASRVMLVIPKNF